jgi:hypothetical protein
LALFYVSDISVFLLFLYLFYFLFSLKLTLPSKRCIESPNHQMMSRVTDSPIPVTQQSPPRYAYGTSAPIRNATCMTRASRSSDDI